MDMSSEPFQPFFLAFTPAARTPSAWQKELRAPAGELLQLPFIPLGHLEPFQQSEKIGTSTEAVAS